MFALIGRLTEAGYLERIDGRMVPSRQFFARPLLGSVRAGVPQPTDQSEPDVLTTDDYLIDDPNRTSLHKGRGDSMRDVGIYVRRRSRRGRAQRTSIARGRRVGRR